MRRKNLTRNDVGSLSAYIIITPMQDMLKVKEFIAKSVHANKKPIGLFYMDKFSGAEDKVDELIDVKDFAKVKKILNLFEKQWDFN